MRRISATITCLSVLGLLACSDNSIERRNVVVLIDYSGSTKNGQLERYSSMVINDVVANLTEHDAIAIYPIDAGAVIRNTQIVSVDLGQHVFTAKGDFVTHADEAVRQRARTFLADTIRDSLVHAIRNGREARKSFVGTTDILGAIQGVAAYFEKTRGETRLGSFVNALMGTKQLHTQNILIVCSDMINETNGMNFETHVPQGKELSMTVDSLKRLDRLPELEGVLVLVTGRTGRTTRQVDNIRLFWEAYFKKAGATLSAYDFDAGTQVRTALITRE